MIEYHERADGSVTVVTTQCSLCGATIAPNEGMARHLRFDCSAVDR